MALDLDRIEQALQRPKPHTDDPNARVGQLPIKVSARDLEVIDAGRADLSRSEHLRVLAYAALGLTGGRSNAPVIYSAPLPLEQRVPWLAPGEEPTMPYKHHRSRGCTRAHRWES